MSFDLESLGFSKEELQERVIDACVQRVFETNSLDEDGGILASASPIAQRLEKAVKQAIDTKVAELAAKHVLPLTADFIENLTLQQTNQWGEKSGAKVTFIEYLVKRADEYMREEVNSDGEDKQSARGSWYGGKQTRIAFMVNKHLHYSIESAMKEALTGANKIIVGGIEETVKKKLAEVSASLKVNVATR